MGKFLVDFIYAVMILINLGMGTPNIPEGMRSMSKTINRYGSPKEYVDWLESLRLVQHYTKKGVA